MRFRRREDNPAQHPFAGPAGVLDGLGAVIEAARAAGEVVLIEPAAAGDAMWLPRGGGANTADAVRTVPRGEMPAMLAGLALGGVRASAVTEHLEVESLAAAAGKRLAAVTHLVCRSRTRHAAATRAAHDDYHAAAGSGAFLMFARNVQEASDFALIARRVAELALAPGVCAQDLYHTSHSLQTMHPLAAGLADRYLGHANDVIAAPNEAQAVVFGATRRRLPVWLDIDRPAGIGGVQDAEAHFRALAAQRPFFDGYVGPVIDEAMRAFGEHTGRTYERVSGYRVDDAELVVVGQGAILEALVPVVDYLREQNRRVGLVNVSVLRPFAGEALSKLLAGRRAVAVLERTHTPHGDAPLFLDVRAALDCAVENAQSPDAPPYPGYATIRRIEDRPRLFSGIYGAGSDLPSFADLVAVFEHMAAQNPARRFLVDARLDVTTRRFPHLETLQQRLEHAYPDFTASALKPASVCLPRDGGAYAIRSLSAQGALHAGNLFAGALRAAMDWQVRTFPDGGLDRNLQPVTLATSYATIDGVARSRPDQVGAILVSSEHLLEELAVESPLERHGILIVGSVQDPRGWWRDLSTRTADWVRGGSFRVVALDARAIAADCAAHAAFVDQLGVWSLLGALARNVLTVDDGKFPRLAQALRDRLAAVDPTVVESIMKAFTRGAEEAREVPWREWSDIVHRGGEPDAPWTVRDVRADATVFDPVRFWNSVGYLYDRGHAALTLADPHLATGVIPARSSASRDLSRYRLRVPEWIASACTGCAECWAQCPESALPATIRPVAELIDAAARGCEQSGPALVQFKRFSQALARQSYQLARESGPQPYDTLGALLDQAFARVVEKAGLAGETLDALQGEFARVRTVVDGFPVAVTERFFTAPHAAASGSGRLLSIAVSPMSCTACGICVTTCAEGAFAWTEQTPERLDRYRRDWTFLTQLPALADTVIPELVATDDPATEALRLLDTRVYHTLVGGDGSFPGNGAKTAVHLVTSAIEAAMRPRYQAHVERLSRLIERIEARIQGTVDATAKINDFEEFGRKLARMSAGELTPDALRRLASDSSPASAPDAAGLARLSRLLHALREQKQRYVQGDGRARMVLVIDPAERDFWHGTYPYNPHPQPWAAHRLGDAVALARGVFDGLVRRAGADLAACRQAEDELEGHAHDTDRPAPVWNEWNAGEKALLPVVLALTDATDADTASLVAAIDGPVPLRVLLLDHDPVRLDGVTAGARAIPQGSGSTFVLQSAISHAGHLMRGVAESLQHAGPALYHIYAPDAVRDGLPADGIVELSRLAVDSRAFPLFVVPPGDRPVLAGNADADADFTQREIAVKEPSGADGVLRTAVTVADWAAQQARFRHHFEIVSRGHRGDRMKPLAEYTALDAGSRESVQPFVNVRDRDGRHALAIVSNDVVRATEAVARAWQELRDASRGAAPPAPATAPSPVAHTPAPARTDEGAVQVLAENLLRLSGYGRDESFFARRLHDFVAKSKDTNGESSE